MKKITLVCIILGFTIGSEAQTQDRIKDLLRQKSVFFQEQGFPSNEYNFEDPAINTHLHLALKTENAKNRANIMGYVLIGVGVVGLIGGASILPDDRNTLENKFTRVFGIALMTAGGACSIASIAMFGMASSKAKRRDRAIQEAKVLHVGLLE